eukprot:TRINITY_DN8421_c0_g2_i1.p1 TRINITY_DN8421_c0_g2~~TRINITY_DN8421_c0_g2_i1.p1  ORF type:complete len:230 (+),score=7.79 TRINITY_DN8421_c0_g2_i1:80-691(+)
MALQASSASSNSVDATVVTLDVASIQREVWQRSLPYKNGRRTTEHGYKLLNMKTTKEEYLLRGEERDTFQKDMAKTLAEVCHLCSADAVSFWPGSTVNSPANWISELNLPVKQGKVLDRIIIRRTVDVPKATKLSGAARAYQQDQRQKILDESIEVEAQADMAPESILLVDDVKTTGVSLSVGQAALEKRFPHARVFVFAFAQ